MVTLLVVEVTHTNRHLGVRVAAMNLDVNLLPASKLTIFAGVPFNFHVDQFVFHERTSQAKTLLAPVTGFARLSLVKTYLLL